ncbi:hypothetical protein C4D60_Mb08t32540 [Musa balbisiana]|uniref:Uncharacterized protein n=1 Tax=Musa balbisiana TaxID=52838 RepID=A0A4S8K860_MUSBA|nr:hypothetical protein C4D60_Mb08t32540 [Musa balbisiana]
MANESARLGPPADVGNFWRNKWVDEVAAPLERLGSAGSSLGVSTPKPADLSIVYGEIRPLIPGIVGNLPRDVGASSRWEVRAGTSRVPNRWATLLYVSGDDFGMKILTT